MATMPLLCPECAATVPYGRLACPSCGTLLASVAGTNHRERGGSLEDEELIAHLEVPRTERAAVLEPSRIRTDVLSEKPAGRAEEPADRDASAEAGESGGADDSGDPDDLAEAVQSPEAVGTAEAESPTEAELPTEAVDTAENQPLAEAGSPAEAVDTAENEPLAEAGSPAEAVGTTETEPLAEAGSPAEAVDTAETEPLAEAGSPEPERPPEAEAAAEEPAVAEQSAEPPESPEAVEADGAQQPAAEGEPEPRATPSVLQDWPGPTPAGYGPADATGAEPSEPAPAEPARPVPGAYLAPSASQSAVLTGGTQPAAQTESFQPSNSQSSRPQASPPAQPIPGQAPLLADLPITAPADLGGWIVAIGSAVSAFSFVLPWAPLTGSVIGAQGDASYFGRWGLANPDNVVLLVTALVLLWLVITSNRVPVWLRFGAIPLIFGGIEIGLTWAYVTGPFGGGLGILVLFVGAILLIIGALSALESARHETSGPGV